MVVLTSLHLISLPSPPMVSAVVGDFDVPPCDVLCNPICDPPVRAASVCQQQQGKQRVAWLARGRRFSSSTSPSVPSSSPFLRPRSLRPPPALPPQWKESTPSATPPSKRASAATHSTGNRPSTDWPQSRGPDRRTDWPAWDCGLSLLSNELRESREGVGRRDDDDDTIGARSCIRDGR